MKEKKTCGELMAHLKDYFLIFFEQKNMCKFSQHEKYLYKKIITFFTDSMKA